MTNPAVLTLEYLERIKERNRSWSAYICQRSLEVTSLIHGLRKFANHKPDSRVGQIVHLQADEIEARLDAVLAKNQSQILPLGFDGPAWPTWSGHTERKPRSMC